MKICIANIAITCAFLLITVAVSSQGAASVKAAPMGNVAAGAADHSADVAALGPLPAQPVLSDILARHLAALGGANALNSIRNTRITSTVTAGGMTGSSITVFEAPNHEYEVDTMGPMEQIQAYDGAVAWEKDTDGPPRKMDRDELREEQSDLFYDSYSYVLPGRMPGKVTLLPGTQSGSGDYIVLVEPSGGKPIKIFIDPRTFLIASDEEDVDGESTITKYANYKMYNGVMFSTVSDETNGDPNFDTAFTVTKIENNTELASGFFSERGNTPTGEFITPGSHIASTVVHQYDGMLSLDCAINGLPVTLILDSGASGLALSRDIVKKLKIKELGYVETSGYGGSIDSYPVSIDSFEVRNCVKISKLTAMAIDMPRLFDRMPGGPIAGIVGYDLLSRFVVQINYKTSKITLIDPNRFVPGPGYGTPLPVQFDSELPEISARLDNLPSALYLVDTGSDAALNLNWPYVKAYKLRSIYKRGTEGIVSGIAGFSFSLGTRVGAFTIAGSTFKDVQAEFSQDPKGGGSVLQAGSLGAPVLSHFILTFDYPHNRIYLKLNPLAGTTFSAESGVKETTKGLKSRLVRVSAKPSSPANGPALLAVQAALKQMGAAVESKNIDAYMNFLTQDFSHKGQDGRSVSRSELKQMMTRMFANVQHLSGCTIIKSFTQKGDKAYATTYSQDTLTTTDPATQKPVSVTINAASKDVWCDVGGEWKEESEVDVSM